jgi:hypothetical protein
MSKKSKQKRKLSEEETEKKAVQHRQQQEASSSDDDVSSEEEGEDLILEGVLMRNPDVESSDDDSDEEPEYEHVKKKAKNSNESKKKAKPKKKDKKKEKTNDDGTEIIPVDFTFNDMNEKYFHGIKNHLLTQSAYAGHSSALSDMIIENVSVGTTVSTADGEDNVYGFASVLNVTTYSNNDAIKKLKNLWLNSCPKEHKREMETVLSGKTKRPAGIFIHGRMVNLPLEITFVLHEQLVKDMDWAVDNAEGGEEERKSLNFGAFVLLAPCSRDNATHSIVYKNFDDEIFAGCAEFVYTISAAALKKSAGGGPKSGDKQDDEKFVNVIVLTKTGHREGMKELKKMIHG